MNIANEDLYRNAGMIVASIAISFLGAFTSTQLCVFPRMLSQRLHFSGSDKQLVCARPECPFNSQPCSSGQS